MRTTNATPNYYTNLLQNSRLPDQLVPCHFLPVKWHPENTLPNAIMCYWKSQERHSKYSHLSHDASEPEKERDVSMLREAK